MIYRYKLREFKQKAKINSIRNTVFVETEGGYVNIVDFNYVQNINKFFTDEVKIHSVKGETLKLGNKVRLASFRRSGNTSVFMQLGDNKITSFTMKRGKFKSIRKKAKKDDDWFGYAQYGIYCCFLVFVGVMLIRYGKQSAQGQPAPQPQPDMKGMTPDMMNKMETLMERFKQMEGKQEEDSVIEEESGEEYSDDSEVKQVNRN